jgi:hypothetical protein
MDGWMDGSYHFSVSLLASLAKTFRRKKKQKKKKRHSERDKK